MVFTKKDGDFHGRTVSLPEGKWNPSTRSNSQTQTDTLVQNIISFHIMISFHIKHLANIPETIQNKSGCQGRLHLNKNTHKSTAFNYEIIKKTLKNTTCFFVFFGVFCPKFTSEIHINGKFHWFFLYFTSGNLSSSRCAEIPAHSALSLNGISGLDGAIP